MFASDRVIWDGGVERRGTVYQDENMSMERNSWALLVGVNQYDDLAISNLHECAGDVQAVYNVLTVM